MNDEINGCLFVGKFGLFKVYCAFQVICLQDVGELKQGDKVWVAAVRSSSTGKIIYEIGGKYYFHHYFTLST